MFSLIADIGGTNVRYALINQDTSEFMYEKYYLCTDFNDFKASLERYVQDLADHESISFYECVKKACIAIAGPVEGDFVQMSNYDWGLSQQDIKESFKLDALMVVNDFLAVAASIPYFRDGMQKGTALEELGLLKIGGGESHDKSAVAVLGPGTGLGMSFLTDHGDGYKAFATEGSDATIAVQTRRQFDIVEQIQKHDPEIYHVNIENLVSGLGIEKMYAALKTLESKENSITKAPDIVEAALNKSCDLAVETLEHFCSLLGSTAGNQALTINAKGGVFIAGGIIPRFKDYFLQSSFHESFKSKGRKDRPFYYEFLASIPIYLITHKNPGFIGLRELVKTV